MQKQFFGDWLPNNILWRQDRMTMANSIEGRVPFLDHRLVNLHLCYQKNIKLINLLINTSLDSIAIKKSSSNSKLRKKPFYSIAVLYDHRYYE